MSPDPRRGEVIRVLERYLVEIVEMYDLCPWARMARQKSELGLEVLWGTPTLDAWIAAAQAALARPKTRVAMVIAPELVIEPAALHRISGEIAAKITSAGVADFHPQAALDLATPARLVPYLRRSPDPLIQLVPFSVLDAVRGPPSDATRVHQAGMLGGIAEPPKPDAAERVAAVNHETVRGAHERISATLDAIAADRRRSYRAAGIGIA